MSEEKRDCTWCGHPEAMHHPTRTETWCIVGVAEAHHCDCPGYNPNGVLRARQWLERVFGGVFPDAPPAGGIPSGEEENR